MIDESRVEYPVEYIDWSDMDSSMSVATVEDLETNAMDMFAEQLENARLEGFLAGLFFASMWMTDEDGELDADVQQDVRGALSKGL